MTGAAAAVQQRVDHERAALLELSHAIHGFAEVAFEEHRSADAIATLLDARGFDVTSGVGGLDTAFRGRVGTGSLHVTLCAEYDALPGIGHACGHNVIAASSVGAALALQPLVDDLDLTVDVLGTPAEEAGGGKVLLLEAGAFEDTHLALMAHPTPLDAPIMPCVAMSQLSVDVVGTAAHASAFPEAGANAADALTVANVAIGLLRQHVPSTARLHGVTLEAGTAPNVVPDRARALWYVRDRDLDSAQALRDRVIACFEAGGTATGTSVAVEEIGRTYDAFRHVPELVVVWNRLAQEAGRGFAPIPGMAAPDYLRLAASTDMANVSHVVPSLHPVIALDSGGALNHQPEFAAAAASPSADAAVADAATLLARTVVEVAGDADLRAGLAEGSLRPTASDLDILRELVP